MSDVWREVYTLRIAGSFLAGCSFAAAPRAREQKYTQPGSNWRPSACYADVIATRPWVLSVPGSDGGWSCKVVGFTMPVFWRRRLESAARCNSWSTAVVMRGVETNMTLRKQQAHGKYAHAGSRTRVTSMGGLYDAATLRALILHTIKCVPR